MGISGKCIELSQAKWVYIINRIVVQENQIFIYKTSSSTSVTWKINNRILEEWSEQQARICILLISVC